MGDGDARARLRAVADELSLYLAGSEAVFLETDLRLRVVRERAGRLVDGAATNASVAVRQDAQLDEGLQSLEHELGKSGVVLRSGAECLARIVAGIDRLSPFAAHFEGISVALWSLALGIRIEDAKSAADGGRFATVVSDVRRLGGLVLPHFEAGLSQARALRATAASALAGAEALLGTQATELTAQLGATRRELASLETIRTSARALRRKVGAASTQLDGSVASIFNSLQMHDVARQIIEQARVELSAYGESPEQDGGAAELADLAVLCQLQCAQLARARAILVSALTDLSADLSRISAAASGLAEHTRKLAELREGSAARANVNRGLRRAGAALDHQLTLERETTAAIRRVLGALREVAGFTRAMDRLASDMKFIALNAQVQAEKGGDTRKPLALLARSIRELSVDVERRTREVGNVMAAVAGERLDEAGDARSTPASDGTPGGVIALLDSLETNNEDLRVGIDELSRDGAALRDDVDELSRKLAINGRAVGAVEALEAILAEVAEEASTRAGPQACREARERLGRAGKTYQMEGQRAVHRAMSGMGPEVGDVGGGGTCELF